MGLALPDKQDVLEALRANYWGEAFSVGRLGHHLANLAALRPSTARCVTVARGSAGWCGQWGGPALMPPTGGALKRRRSCRWPRGVGLS